MQPSSLFDVARTVRPADWFERILPSQPWLLPAIRLPWGVAYRVQGVGGGTWSVHLTDGAPRVAVGRVGQIAMQVSMSTAHFRELVAGALRQRLATALVKSGQPLALPDLRRVHVDREALADVARQTGSLRIEVMDREVDDVYHYTVTLGSAEPRDAHADCTVTVDADDLAGWVGDRVRPMDLLVFGKLRIEGDVELPARAMRLAALVLTARP